MEIVNYIINALLSAGLFMLVCVLPWIIVALVMQLFSNSLRKSMAKLLGVKGYVYLTCPGVMVHELGHAVFCVIFGHHINEMKLFSPEEDGTLGYVNHSYNPKSRYQNIGNFFIGTGPIWFGIAVLWLISKFFLPDGILNGDADIFSRIERLFAFICSLEFWTDWKSYLWLYLAITVSSHVTLSPPDLAGAVKGGAALVSFIVLAFLLFGWLGHWELNIISFFTYWFLSLFGILLLFLCILFAFSLFFKIITWKK